VRENARDKGFERHYNAQTSVDEASLLIVGYSVSNHPTDVNEVGATMVSSPAELGVVAEVEGQGQGIDLYIATARHGPRRDWQEHCEPGAEEPEPGPEATARERRGDKLRTALGKAIYRGRKCTVEPVLGIVSSKRCWGSGRFRCAAWRRRRGNGVWCAWHTI
jgi:hypothetical protein